ncbi:hypothetical protein [Epilithonimonas zeae]|uniref:hypothetical protein n=1 Tax=Epilithonimonas zeae TaxID=1416779 RepID=UPI002010B9B9|nr:hypothetical protein [Epilithonimonas zeae]UQB69960.1 hypothetical protein KI430_05915 [Epilithonimonas zeae]
MKIIISIFILLLTSNIFFSQDLRLYTPILIVNAKDTIIDGNKVNKVVADYYNPDFKKMEKEYLRYDSNSQVVEIYDKKSNFFKPFINLKFQGETIENYFGMFKYFKIIQNTKNEFKTSSATGNFPSHFEKINSIEILQKEKRYLILKFNYSDIYGFRGFGVLSLTDFQ